MDIRQAPPLGSKAAKAPPAVQMPTTLAAKPVEPSSLKTPALDTTTLNYMKTLRLKVFRTKEVPWRSMGQYKYRIMEDGTATHDRLSIVESAIPPKSHGPIMHYHEMHDETFYVTEGAVRFHSPGSKPVDVGEGDMVIVPTRLPHRFSNPFDREARFVSTNTPGHYARYFYYMEFLIGEGNKLTPEVNKEAMRRFATVPLADEDLELLERELAVNYREEETVVGEGVSKTESNGHGEDTRREGGPGWTVLD